MTPLADLSASIAGWSAIVAGRSDAAQQFRTDRAGIVVAALWLLVGMLLSVAVQSAMYGLPHVVSVLFSLIGEAVTLGLLWLALVQLFRFLRIGSPPLALFVPILYLLAYVFVISAVLQLVSQAFGLILMLGVAILIFRAAQVICGLKTMPAARVAGAAFIVLVVVPNALYMLLLFLPSA